MSLAGEHPTASLRIDIDGGPGFEVAPGEDALLRGAVRAGVAFPYECSVGGCGACRFELIEGEMTTLWDGAPGLSERERRRGKRLACQSRPLGDCRIRVRLDDSASTPAQRPRRQMAILVSRRVVTAEMSEFTLHLPVDQPFLPGQYALVGLPGVQGKRAYSMAHRHEADGLWRFVVRRVPGGCGSTMLFDGVAIGDQVEVDGPYGHAWLRPGQRDVVCIAGGSGLGPMLSVAAGVLADPGVRRVHFFLGLRSQSELAAAAEVDALGGGPRLRLATVLSSPVPGVDWSGPTGFVHTEVEAVLPAPLDRHDFYFAGPAPMVEAVQNLLMVRHRVPFEQIHFDRFV